MFDCPARTNTLTGFGGSAARAAGPDATGRNARRIASRRGVMAVTWLVVTGEQSTPGARPSSQPRARSSRDWPVGGRSRARPPAWPGGRRTGAVDSRLVPPGPFLPRDPVLQGGPPHHLGGIESPLAQPLGDPDRGGVL